MLIQFSKAGPNAATFTIETRIFSHEVLTKAMVEQAHVADPTLRFFFNEGTGVGQAFVGANIPVGNFQVWPVIPPTKGGDAIPH